MLEAYLPKVLCGFVLHCRNICCLKERVTFGICPEHFLSVCPVIDSIFLSDLKAQGCAECVAGGTVDLGREEWTGLRSLLSTFEGQVRNKVLKGRSRFACCLPQGPHTAFSSTPLPILAINCHFMKGDGVFMKEDN